MKLISLNTWGGRAGKDIFLNFFERNCDTDIFCLQEVWNGGEDMIGKSAGGRPLEGILHTLLSDVAGILTDHRAYFHPHFREYYGLGMFVRRSLLEREAGDAFVYKENGYISDEEVGNHARNIEYVTLETPHGEHTVINFHGLWNGKGKGDSEDRLTQSDNIVSFLNGLQNPFVLCGDFNLHIDTESLKKFEDAGLRNLIREYGIPSTRTPLYDKPTAAAYADYMFVDESIVVKDFKVMPDVVSDHAPLYLEFE